MLTDIILYLQTFGTEFLTPFKKMTILSLIIGNIFESNQLYKNKTNLHRKTSSNVYLFDCLSKHIDKILFFRKKIEYHT